MEKAENGMTNPRLHSSMLPLPSKPWDGSRGMNDTMTGPLTDWMPRNGSSCCLGLTPTNHLDHLDRATVEFSATSTSDHPSTPFLLFQSLGIGLRSFQTMGHAFGASLLLDNKNHKSWMTKNDTSRTSYCLTRDSTSTSFYLNLPGPLQHTCQGSDWTGTKENASKGQASIRTATHNFHTIISVSNSVACSGGDSVRHIMASS